MNFDEIKNEMDESVKNSPKKEVVINLAKGNNNPVQIIRQNMKKEIVTQLLGIVFLMTYPAMIKMDAFSRSTYLIFMAITSLMTLCYVIKLTIFVKKTSDFTSNTKDALQNFMFEARLTLEVYKSFIIAGSLLLPTPIFALLSRDFPPLDNGMTVFEKWFRLSLNGGELTLLIFVYILAAIGFFWMTIAWANMMYGKHLKKLQNLIDRLEEEN